MYLLLIKSFTVISLDHFNKNVIYKNWTPYLQLYYSTIYYFNEI